MSSLLSSLRVAGLAAGFGMAAASAQAPSPEPPNIIVVNLDDISPAWFPPYARKLKPGDVEQKICQEYAAMHKDEGTFDLPKTIDAACHSTPFIDSLAQNGMVFDRCFATASTCAPSRSALLTSCYQQRWGAYSIPDVDAAGVPASVPVMPEYFQKAGYLCGIVGKWHIAEHDPALAPAKGQGIGTKIDKKGYYVTSSKPGQGPLDRGFDYYFGYNHPESAYYNAGDLWDGRQEVPQRPKGEFLTDLFNAKCADFVNRALAEKKRFLLYYAPMALHGALLPPPEKYTSQFHTGIPFTDQYAAHLLAVDTGIHNLYDILKAHGQDQNTLFILSADNGQTWYRVPPYNAPYRGGKGTGWLGGTHEPLIISWPARLRAGWHSELVSTMDIFATALDAAGLKPAKPIDGRSLLPLMLGQTKVGPHSKLFSAALHATAWSDNYFKGDAVQVERTNYHDEPTCPLYAWRQDDVEDSLLMYISKTDPHLYPEFPDGRPEQKLFFNLRVDPQEENNIFADTPQVQEDSLELGEWLDQLKPPVVKHAAHFQQLRAMSATPQPLR
jgi:uncharacterized sulfatase